MSEKAESKDPLLECLIYLTGFYHVQNSRDQLIDGLPLPANKLTLALFPRAAATAGLTCKQVNTPLKQLSSLLLPAIILLDNDQACILFEMNDKQARIFVPGEQGEQWLELELLNRQYIGCTLLLKLAYRFDERSPEILSSDKGHWFWSTLWSSSSIYRDVMLASVLINLFAITSPLFVMNVYDKIVPNLAFESLWVLAIGAAIVFSFDFIMRLLRSYFIDVAGKKSDVLLSSKIFAKVMGMRLEFRPSSVGAFTRHLQEFEVIRDFFTSATVTALIDLPFSLLFLLVIWFFAGDLVFIPLVALSLLLLYSLLIQRPLRTSIESGSRLAAQKYANLVEGIAGIETVKLTASQSQFQHRWEQAVGHIANWGIKTRQLSNSVASFASYLQQMVTVALVVYGVYLIADGLLTMGGLIAAVMLGGRAIAPMIQLSILSTRYNHAKSALSILDQLMQAPDESELGKQYIHRKHLKGDIKLHDVCFHYPNQNINALYNLNIDIKAGEKLALIGRVGSGKSTISRILLGLYQPQSGAIQIDGVEIKQLHPAELRRNISVVTQDITLFYGSIRDNIAMGAYLADDDQIMEVAKLSGVTLFSDHDENGLNRQVGEGGRLLSGGQRQSIGLARALLAKSAVLILDEPTSQMDKRCEMLVKETLAALPKSTTVIMITHKSSMLDLADRLLVLERGQLVADGPKEQVLKKLNSGGLVSPSMSKVKTRSNSGKETHGR